MQLQELFLVVVVVVVVIELRLLDNKYRVEGHRGSHNETFVLSNKSTLALQLYPPPGQQFPTPELTSNSDTPIRHLITRPSKVKSNML